MNEMKILLSRNLMRLRNKNKYSLEYLADKIGVSRQAISKWENGEALPDLINCEKLATLYNITLDNLLHFDESKEGYPIPPKGKHLFGTVLVGERGQIFIPKKAREVLNISSGETLVVLGNEDPENRGIALIKGDDLLHFNSELTKILERKNEEE